MHCNRSSKSEIPHYSWPKTVRTTWIRITDGPFCIHNVQSSKCQSTHKVRLRCGKDSYCVTLEYATMVVR
jgi:hypothetical protein